MSSSGNAVKGTAKAKLHKARKRNGTEKLGGAEAKHCRTEQRRRVEPSGVCKAAARNCESLSGKEQNTAGGETCLRRFCRKKKGGSRDGCCRCRSIGGRRGGFDL